MLAGAWSRLAADQDAPLQADQHQRGELDHLDHQDGLDNDLLNDQVPGLVNLLQEGETLADLMKLGPEEILNRWVNYQLEKVGMMVMMGVT